MKIRKTPEVLVLLDNRRAVVLYSILGMVSGTVYFLYVQLMFRGRHFILTVQTLRGYHGNYTHKSNTYIILRYFILRLHPHFNLVLEF